MTAAPPKPLTITGRILGYPSPNMLIEGKKPIFIQEPAQREKVAADFPVGTIVTIQTENGTLKGDPVVATGTELEKFEKREERKREQAGKSAKLGPLWIDKSLGKGMEIETNEGTPFRKDPKELTTAERLIQAAAYGEGYRKGWEVGINKEWRSALICPTMSTTSLTPTPCQKQNCRMFVSCWMKEAEAMRVLGMGNAAEDTECEIRRIVGEKKE
jgi:hypothetical protein